MSEEENEPDTEQDRLSAALIEYRLRSSGGWVHAEEIEAIHGEPLPPPRQGRLHLLLRDHSAPSGVGYRRNVPEGDTAGCYRRRLIAA